jgi:hypothetical protein
MTVLALEIAVPAPDTDFMAHQLWARQILDSGSVQISVDARWDDCSIYYPNTVPKPAQLLQLLAGELAGGTAAHAILRVILAFAAVAMASRAVMRSSASPGVTLFAGLALGLNPAFVSLARSGSPSIPFLALLFIPGATAALAACLVRPEGFLYAAADAVSRRKWWILAALLPIASAWPLLNAWMAGNPFWSALEVRYNVAAMPFETPGPLGFWPWAAGRAFLVMGPLLLAALLLRPRSWPKLAGGLAHLALLFFSLLLGSLALPRYVDQVFLLALPWAVMAAAAIPLPRRIPRRLAAAAAFAGALILWPSALRSMLEEHRIALRLAEEGRAGWEGRLAINELLVPGIALAAGIDDPRFAFVAVDRMIYEGRHPADLEVTRIVVVPGTEYLPDRTALWLDAHPGLPVDTLEAFR